MPITENATVNLEGMYHDILRDPDGQIVWDRGWKKNSIVVSCRRLLASFMRGNREAFGITGLRVGAGRVDWDRTPAKSEPTSSFADPEPWPIPRDALTIDFLDGANVSASPTNRLQIHARLGPSVPPWPDSLHLTSSLREFGLVGQLDGEEVLLNYVIHPVITKDPYSTLERTIWLVF